MYWKKNVQQNVEDFILTFNGTLSADNRWVIKAGLLSWYDIEGDYLDLFHSGTSNVAKLARVAFGSLLIKETLGLTDEETVKQIRENPYLQYFLGFKEFIYEKTFDPSFMVRFRKRFGKRRLNEVNEIICGQGCKDDDEPQLPGTVKAVRIKAKLKIGAN